MYSHGRSILLTSYDQFHKNVIFWAVQRFTRQHSHTGRSDFNFSQIFDNFQNLVLILDVFITAHLDLDNSGVKLTIGVIPDNGNIATFCVHAAISKLGPHAGHFLDFW